MKKSEKELIEYTILLVGLMVFFILLVIFLEIALGEFRALGLRQITGFPGARDYLIVFQNDAERRPSGGFITSFALLKFRFGIPLFEFGNVYDPKLIQPGSKPPDPLVTDLAEHVQPGNQRAVVTPQDLG